MHALVTTEVGELSVRLQAHFAHEWLDTAVDVLMLLETAWRPERLATRGTGVESCAGVLLSDVAVEK